MITIPKQPDPDTFEGIKLLVLGKPVGINPKWVTIAFDQVLVWPISQQDADDIEDALDAYYHSGFQVTEHPTVRLLALRYLLHRIYGIESEAWVFDVVNDLDQAEREYATLFSDHLDKIKENT